MIKDKHGLAGKNFGTLISEGFSLFARTYLKVILPFALFYILTLIVNTILLAPLNAGAYEFYWSHYDLIEAYRVWNPYTEENPFSAADIEIISLFITQLNMINFIELIIGGIFSTLTLCTVSLYLLTIYTKGKSEFISDMKISLTNSRIVFAILIGLCSSLLYGISMSGFLSVYGYLLLIPNLIFFCYFIFIVFTYHNKDVNNPIRESRLIARGQMLRIFGVFVLSYIIFEVVRQIVNFFLTPFLVTDFQIILYWYSDLSNYFMLIFLYRLMLSIITIVFSPLFLCLITPLFVSAKSRKQLGARFGGLDEGPRESSKTTWESKIEKTPTKKAKSEKSSELYKSKGKDIGTPAKKTTAPKRRKGGLYCPHCGIIIRTATKYCPKCKGKVDFDL